MGANVAQPTETEREYRCSCGGFLTRSAATWGVLKDVYCTSCHKRHTVFLGGRRAPERVTSEEVECPAN